MFTEEARAKFKERFLRWKNGDNPYSAGKIVDAIYQNNPKEEFLGEPDHHYDFTQSEEWADAHGYYPDERGHRDDRVKKPAHPSHPSRGRWFGDNFILTEMGMLDPNYIFFGLNDGGQDPQAVLKYKDGIVLPEITVTPKGNYFYNSYDNIRLRLPKKDDYVPQYKDGKDTVEQNDATRVDNTNFQIANLPKLIRTPWLENQTYIGPNQNVPQQLQDYYRLKDETRRWAQNKKAVEEATDEMMLGMLDPRYIAAGSVLGGALKGVGSIAKAGIKLAKNFRNGYKISKAIDSAVQNTKLAIPAKPAYKITAENAAQPLQSISTTNEIQQAITTDNANGILTKIPQHILDEFEKTTLTRMVSDLLPDRAQKALQAYREMLPTHYMKYPPKKIPNRPNADGVYNPNTRLISATREDAIGHELRHFFDYDGPLLNRNEVRELSEAYNDDFLEYWGNDPVGMREMVTSNYDVRKAFLNSKNALDLPLEQQNKLIELATGNDLYYALKLANSYTESYLARMLNSDKYMGNFAKLYILTLRNIKNAMRNIPSVVPYAIGGGAAVTTNKVSGEK